MKGLKSPNKYKTEERKMIKKIYREKKNERRITRRRVNMLFISYVVAA